MSLALEEEEVILLICVCVIEAFRALYRPLILNVVLQSWESSLKVLLHMAKVGGWGVAGAKFKDQSFVSLITSLVCPVQIFEGGYHCLHHDLPEVAESVLKDVTGWILERLPAVTLQQP